MSSLKAGDKFPSDVKFEWAPITDPDPTACGAPQEYNASEEFKGKKVVLVSVPGAFTPGCQAMHIPPYFKNLDAILAKADLVVVIGFNDSWVMSAWGKVNGAKPDSKILFMSDSKTKFAHSIGWNAAKQAPERNGRFAMIIEKDGTISYAEIEGSIGEVNVSGADTILSRL